jgi:hypothetical protein
MWRMKCPKCGRGIKWWPSDLFLPNCGKKECAHCAGKFELTNPAVCSAVNGLLFSGIMVLLTVVGLRPRWLIGPAAGLVSWFIYPFIVWLLGRWHSRSYRGKDLWRARVWAIVGAVSGWVFAIAVAFTAIGFGLFYREFLTSLGSVEEGISSQAIEDFARDVKFWLPVGGGGALIALVLAKTAKLRRSQIRREQQLEGTE